MTRIIRMIIVLGIALVALEVSIATAAELQSDAVDRALASEAAVPTDASDRAQTVVVIPTDAHERAPVGTSAGPVVEGTGWSVGCTDVVLAAAIGVGVVAAGVLLVSAIRRYPPRGHPPLAHR